FAEDEGLLPYTASSMLGYRLLTEFFVFPEKFLFIDIEGLDKYIPANATSELNIYIYLNQSNIELEHNISEQTFVLGCTPVINLFEHKADPIKVDHAREEYQIVPDIRRPQGFEVYAVNQVIAAGSDGSQTPFI